MQSQLSLCKFPRKDLDFRRRPTKVLLCHWRTQSDQLKNSQATFQRIPRGSPRVKGRWRFNSWRAKPRKSVMLRWRGSKVLPSSTDKAWWRSGHSSNGRRRSMQLMWKQFDNTAKTSEKLRKLWRQRRGDKYLDTPRLYARQLERRRTIQMQTFSKYWENHCKSTGLKRNDHFT